MTIKVKKYYVQKDNYKCKVIYSLGNLNSQPNRDCITLYAKTYDDNLSKIFNNAENESDMMTDYFEKDRVRIFKDTMPELFNQCLQYAS